MDGLFLTEGDKALALTRLRIQAGLLKKKGAPVGLPKLSWKKFQVTLRDSIRERRLSGPPGATTAATPASMRRQTGNRQVRKPIGNQAPHPPHLVTAISKPSGRD